MIMPTKHIPTEQSLLGVSAQLLKALSRSRTVSSLWDEMRSNPNVATFERFTLALDLLYALDAVTLSEGLLQRSAHD